MTKRASPWVVSSQSVAVRGEFAAAVRREEGRFAAQQFQLLSVGTQAQFAVQIEHDGRFAALQVQGFALRQARGGEGVVVHRRRVGVGVKAVE